MKEGEPAPNFELPAHDGSTVSLESYRGSKNVILCFYPKNRLFGCPSKKVFEMAKSVIGSHSGIASADSVLFAISSDSVESQKKFTTEHDIPYMHLSDPKKQACRMYAGLNIAGLAKRSTFIVDKQGIVRKIFRKMDVQSHGPEILEFVRGLE